MHIGGAGDGRADIVCQRYSAPMWEEQQTVANGARYVTASESPKQGTAVSAGTVCTKCTGPKDKGP